jgi:hypothetical protein
MRPSELQLNGNTSRIVAAQQTDSGVNISLPTMVARPIRPATVYSRTMAPPSRSGGFAGPRRAWELLGLTDAARGAHD